ncbi:deoxyuridine 5'-triphosphate nucleotidohydrolase [Xylaria telfairii]|nr:deoxyuridine 5'-triphosphate nucleotidohydrolase [Xylaria telfairii]
MTVESVTSPPNSPPTKRVKTDNDNSITDTMAESTTTSLPIRPPEGPPSLLVKKLTEKGRLPTRGSAFAAGYDMYSSQATMVPARGKVLVNTDISISVPAGTYGRVAPRSGLASQHSIQTGAGVIDADYRGQVKILLFNHSDVDFNIAEGDRIAQLIIERIYTPEVIEVEELEASVRGAGGFGSTGTN